MNENNNKVLIFIKEDNIIMQVYSYNNNDFLVDKNQCMINITNKFLIKKDLEIFDFNQKNNLSPKDKKFKVSPTIHDESWDDLEEKQKEMFKELYNYGENTRIARRFWKINGQNLNPVVMISDNS